MPTTKDILLNTNVKDVIDNSVSLYSVEAIMRYFNITRVAVYWRVKHGLLPKPTKCGKRLYWTENDIQSIIIPNKLNAGV